ncbi:MAG: hypothetical protein R3F62_09645 [Planctomycetota bacterium]
MTRLSAVWLLLTAVAFGGEIEVRGSLEGEPVQGTVRRIFHPDGSKGIEVVLKNGLRGEATKLGAGLYRFELAGSAPAKPSVGLRGALLGEEASASTSGDAPRLSLLLTNDGRELTGVLYRDGQPVGNLGAQRREQAPEAVQTRRGTRYRHPSQDELGEPVRREQSLTRNAPVLRQATATWGTTRAVWDLVKPGSRGLEELRGATTVEDTRRMRERMNQVPAPWTPAQVFRVARGLEPTDRAALELSFAFMVDQRDVPLRQLPGIDSPDVHDKFEHFFASAILAHRSNASGSFAVGWIKEVVDEVNLQLGNGTGYSEDDLIADALGAEFGQGLLEGKLID